MSTSLPHRPYLTISAEYGRSLRFSKIDPPGITSMPSFCRSGGFKAPGLWKAYTNVQGFSRWKLSPRYTDGTILSGVIAILLTGFPLAGIEPDIIASLMW